MPLNEQQKHWLNLAEMQMASGLEFVKLLRQSMEEEEEELPALPMKKTMPARAALPPAPVEEYELDEEEELESTPVSNKGNNQYTQSVNISTYIKRFISENPNRKFTLMELTKYARQAAHRRFDKREVGKSLHYLSKTYGLVTFLGNGKYQVGQQPEKDEKKITKSKAVSQKGTKNTGLAQTLRQHYAQWQNNQMFTLDEVAASLKPRGFSRSQIQQALVHEKSMGFINYGEGPGEYVKVKDPMINPARGPQAA